MILEINTNMKSAMDEFINGNKSLADVPVFVDTSKNFIRAFFKKTGSGDDIRNIYNALAGDYKLKVKAVSAVDVQKGYDLFMNDLFPGMNKYITDTVCKGIVNEGVDKNLSASLSAICEFTESIFGGSRNPIGERSCDKIMSDLENLIAFISGMDQLADKAKRVEMMLQSRLDNQTVMIARELYSKTVVYFIYNYVTSIIKNVNAVNEVISPIPTEEPVAPKKPVFKLFV